MSAAFVVGIGASADADGDEVRSLIADALDEASVSPDEVRLIATLDSRVDHPALRGLDWPVVGHTADQLAGISAPTPNSRVASETGTPSVAEAAALVAVGEHGELVVTKRRSAHATVAVARSAVQHDRRPTWSARGADSGAES